MNPATQTSEPIVVVSLTLPLSCPLADLARTDIAATIVAVPATVEHDLQRGRFLGAEEALAYGILDEVARPDAPVRRLPGTGPPPMGFRPVR